MINTTKIITMVNTYSSLVLLHPKSTQNKVMTMIYIYNRSIYQYIKIHTQKIVVSSHTESIKIIYTEFPGFKN